MNYKNIILEVEKAKTIESLQNIFKNSDFGNAKFDETKYPKIDFQISKDELKELEQKKAIGKQGHLNHEYFKNGNNLSPIEKILYSYVWKRGELNRFPSLISGIRGENYESTTGQVLNQFGKYLSKDSHNEPIVDQHVIRAFKTYVVSDLSNSKRTLTQTVNLEIIEEYKNWIIKLVEKNGIIERKLAIEIIDKIMFSIGKSLKRTKTRGNK